MKLAPHVIQSMEILQMPQAALEERIEKELEENAILELADGEPPAEGAAADAPAGAAELPDGEATAAAAEESRGSGNDEFERLSSFEEANPEAAENEFDERERPRTEEFDRAASSRLAGEPDAKSEAMANTAAKGLSPQEQLREQWLLTDVDGQLRSLGEQIIGYIEDDGYLRTDLATIASKLPPPVAPEIAPTPEQMERALRAVQLLLEPPGIGARDQRECLLLQIDAREADGSGPGSDPEGWATARRIVEEHLDDLANNRLPRISQRLGVGVDEVKRAIDKLRTLSLAPGRALRSESESPVYPDAIIEYDPENDRYYAYLNDSRVPNLRINQEYAKLVKDRQAPKATREFLRTNLSNAQFLIDAIQQRRRTILRVVEAVAAAQREFFDFGPQAIKPLPMTKVAEQLGVHVATVSRAVADKYVQTPRGMVALRKFFTGGTVTEAGEEVSWDAIKAALSDIVTNEDKKSPLSDDELADELKKRGLDIARRTVAKYRGQLGIPTGRLRKAY